MQFLEVVSEIFHETAPEGRIPEDSVVSELREDVQELIVSASAADLPPAVKRPVLQCLADMLEALEHLDIGAPDSVKRAAEALAATATLYQTEEVDPSTFERARAVARKAFAIVSVGSVVATASLGWYHVFEPEQICSSSASVERQLSPGREETERPQRDEHAETDQQRDGERPRPDRQQDGELLSAPVEN